MARKADAYDYCRQRVACNQRFTAKRAILLFIENGTDGLTLRACRGFRNFLRETISGSSVDFFLCP